MSRRIAALAGLLALLIGCTEPHRAALVSDNPLKAPPPGPMPDMRGAPAAEEAGRRVAVLGKKLIDANPQIGLRPLFVVAGATKPEIFYRGGPTTGYQVIVTDSLVRECPRDEQLVAVLALQLGRIVSEREAAVGPGIRQPEQRPPISVPVGNDVGGHFGTSDGTRFVEMARYDRQRAHPSAVPRPPVPEKLAQQYLQKAGYPPAELEHAGRLMQKAEQNYNLEKAMKDVQIGPPIRNDKASNPGGQPGVIATSPAPSGR